MAKNNKRPMLPHEELLATHGRAPIEDRKPVDWHVSMATDPRRSQEILDSRMIQEDRNAMANLPEQPIHREFNAWTFPRRNYEDDGISR